MEGACGAEGGLPAIDFIDRENGLSLDGGIDGGDCRGGGRMVM